MYRISCKKLCVFFFLFVIAFGSQGQPADSLFNLQLDTIASEVKKIDFLLEFSKKISYSNPNRAFELANKALVKSLEASYEKGEAESYMRIGVYWIYHNDYPKALENMFQAEKIALKIDNKELTSKILMNLGNIYYDNKDRDKAIDYFDRALKLAKEINDKDDIAGCLMNFGNVYSDNGEFKLANENFQKALKIYNEINLMQGIARALFNIGNVYFYQENYNMALDYYQQSLKVEREEDDKLDIIIALNAIGKVYMKMNRDNEALDFCTQSLDLAWETNSEDDISKACYSLSSIYKKRKDYKNALAYFTMASNIRESLFNDEKNKEFGKLEARHLTEKQESEIALLKKDKSLKEEQAAKDKLTKNITIAFILMFSLVVVSVILYTKNRKEHQINQKLIARNKEIAAQAESLKILNEELDQFVYRSSHDLKAPLTSVLGLLTIIQMDHQDLNVVNYLDKIKLSIDKLMLVLQDLTNYSRNARMKIEIQPIDFQKLISNAFADLHYLDNLHRIKIETNLNTATPFHTDLVRLKILVTNIISNAIAHHDIIKPSPYINIEVDVNNERAVIKVKDNGKGISEKFKDKIFDMFFKGSNDSQGSGLGLYIANGVIKKLNGTLEFESNEGLGTTFILTIPNNSARA